MNDEPNWAPLERIVAPGDLDHWMWMGRSEHGDRVIEAYKHRSTRRYLNLDQDGQAWRVRVVAVECDPWCAEDHKHRSDPVQVVEPMSLADALSWALS